MKDEFEQWLDGRVLPQGCNVECLRTGWDAAMESMKKEQKLMAHCKKFVLENEISSAETVHQCDWVIENAYEFIEKCCRIAGWHKHKEE